ncbi:MAG: nucleoside hydrolase-like domain-containing protein [Cyclobacteriaceae bacterium]
MQLRFSLILFLLIFLSFTLSAQTREKIISPKSQLKPRIVVLTDVSTWETDDSESLVRLLAHADMFEIEGLIYTTGFSLEETRDDFFDLILEAIDAYEKDLPNLMKRSNQNEFLNDESKQIIGYWPSPEYLRGITMYGSKKRGFKHIGKDNISPGSNLIIELADEDDERPLWITLWGGGNTLAQSIWQVQQDRSKEDLNTFLHKIPTYAITDQDRSYKSGTSYNTSAQQWMRKEFEKDLLFIWDENAYKYQNNMGKENWDQYATQIQGHGNLGDVYPKYKFGVEGDTPAFLHIMPNGLNNPLIPNQVGWGGYFEWDIGPDNETYAFTNHQGSAHDISLKYQEYFYQATFNNFASRMDWAKEGTGNRNPIVVINGDNSIDIMTIKSKQGKSVKLDASNSYDPEGDKLNFKWWVLTEVGTYKENITIKNSNTSLATVIIPANSAGKTFHVICEVTDNGIHNLTSYRRIIFVPTK